jgi:hypothetical protein
LEVKYPNDEMSHSSSLHDDSKVLISLPPSSQLSISGGALLLVAECVGTGILTMSYFSTILGGPLPTLGILSITQAVNIYAGEQLLGAVEKVETRRAWGAERVTDLPSLAGDIPSHKVATSLSFDGNLFLVLGAYLLTMEVR